jgi:hypothetical protein
MALVRLCGHFVDNPNHIDKLICIKGLPENFFFRPCRLGGKELVPPWKPDVESTIPQSIRHLCEEQEIKIIYSPIEKGKEPVVDTVKIIGLRLDFGTEPGQEMWAKIERYLEKSVSRDQAVPKPVLCAPNQKSEFNPHEARRTVRGSLEFRPAEIPVIDLRPTLAPEVPLVSQPAIQTASVNTSVPAWHCKKCPTQFTDLKSLRVHNLRGHRKVKEKVGV